MDRRMNLSDNKPNVQDPLWTQPFVLLVIGHFLQALGWSSMLLLPLYVKHIGATETQLGLVMAASSVGGLILRPVVGWSLDNIGRRHTLVAGTLVLFLGMFLIGFVQVIGWQLFTARVLIGIGGGTLFTGYFTYVSDFIPESRRTEGLALFGISGLLPVGFNALIHRLDIPIAELNQLYPYVSTLILASLVALLFVPETRGQVANRRPAPRPRAFDSLLSRPLISTWLATIVFSTMVAVFMAFITVTGRLRDIVDTPDLWAFYASGAVGVRLFGGRLPDLIGTHNMVVPALAAYASAFVLAAGAQDYFTICLAGTAAGLGHGYCFPVLTSQVVSRIDSRLKGVGLAAFTAIWEVTSLTLTPLFGLFADHYGLGSMFAMGAVAATIGCAIWVFVEQVGSRAPKT